MAASTVALQRAHRAYAPAASRRPRGAGARPPAPWLGVRGSSPHALADAADAADEFRADEAPTRALVLAWRLLLELYHDGSAAEPALRRVLRGACMLLGVPRAACFAVLDAEHGHAMRVHESEPGALGRDEQMLTALARRVVESGGVVVVDATRPNELLERTLLCVPVLDRGARVGALMALDQPRAVHAPTDPDTLALLAEVAGCCVAHAAPRQRVAGRPAAAAAVARPEHDPADAERLRRRLEAADLALLEARGENEVVAAQRAHAAVRALHAEEQLREARAEAGRAAAAMGALERQLDQRNALVAALERELDDMRAEVRRERALRGARASRLARAAAEAGAAGGGDDDADEAGAGRSGPMASSRAGEPAYRARQAS